jgi:hypothetical protein
MTWFMTQALALAVAVGALQIDTVTADRIIALERARQTRSSAVTSTSWTGRPPTTTRP